MESLFPQHCTFASAPLMMTTVDCKRAMAQVYSNCRTPRQGSKVDRHPSIFPSGTGSRHPSLKFSGTGTGTLDTAILVIEIGEDCLGICTSTRTAEEKTIDSPSVATPKVELWLLLASSASTRAYRPAEGGERACNSHRPFTDGEMVVVTKNNVSGFLIRLWQRPPP